ncbi:MAG: fumarate hydratase [Arhodomonas sp.]|nr:fumarate hydratase [Arhodomonas sp.]
MTTTIRQEDLIDSVADALQYISYYHPRDFIDAVHEAYEREQSPAAKDAMAQILVNSRHVRARASAHLSGHRHCHRIPQGGHERALGGRR